MSTSDAGAPELGAGVGGGETATPLYGTDTRTAAARGDQDETFGRKQENHLDEGVPAEQNQPAVQQKETNKALRADSLKRDETSHGGESEVLIQKPAGPRFTSSLLLRLSRSLHLHQPELKENLDPCLHSSREPQQVESKDGSVQVNGRTPRHTSVETTSVCSLSETVPFPAKEEDGVITVCNEPKITRDLSSADIFLNGDFRPHEHNGSHIPPRLSPPRTCTEVELEGDLKDRTKRENQTDIGELSDPPAAMLSSTVVTVLAPHWSGRLRRNKRLDGTGNSDAQGNLQDVTNIAAQRGHGFQVTQNQHGMDRVLTDGSQAQLRAPFLGPRRNTVGWSAKSEPSGLDYETKRQMTHTVSLDVNSGRMTNRQIDAGTLSPLSTTKSSVSSLFHNPNDQRRDPQSRHQGGLSSLSSKPITSSLLLSLRRFNSNGGISDSTYSDVNPLSPSSPSSDRNGKLFSTHLSQSFLNNNDQDRTKPLLSPSSISYRPTETGPVLSPSSSSIRERNISDAVFFSTSPINRDAGGTASTQHPQTINRIQPSLTSSKQAFPSTGLLERHQNSRDSNESTNLLSENMVSTARHSPYDHSALLKTHSVPKRTSLKSTSWWKQVSHESSAPLILNDTSNIKDRLNTPFVPPFNDNGGMTSPTLTDNKTLGSHMSSNRDNSSTTESVCKGNMNFVLKTQGGTHNLKQRIPENSLDHEPHRFVKQQYGSNLNNREPQKPYSMPDALCGSKISRATAQTTLSHPKDPCKPDASSSSFTASVTELPPTLLNPKSSNTPTESSSKYKNSPCPAKTNNTPLPLHNMDSQKFTKPSLSLDFTTTYSSPALVSQTTSGLPPATNTKNSFPFSSPSVSSQTSIHASSYTGSLSQTPQLTNKSNTTPLGFERTYASTPKPFQPKTSSSLIPSVSSFSKTNYSSASTTSCSNTGSHPVSPASTSPSFLSPPVTTAMTSSPTSISPLLTPPATPVISSPNYLETSSPKGGKTFPSSPETDPKKRSSAEGKKARRVTWEDSVDVQVSEPTTVEKQEPSRAPTNVLSPSRFSRNAPSIFSFLRSSSPTTSTSPLPSPTPKTSSIQVGKGGKYRSLSSDSADLTSREKNKQRTGDTMLFDQGKQDLTTPRQERTLSVESGTVPCCSSAPLSLPPDFSGYKLRYSSPPYSTLMSNRQAHGEAKTLTPRARLFSQPSQSNLTPQLPLNTASKPPLSPVRPSQSMPLSSQRKPAVQESVVSETDQVNNNHSKNNAQDRQNNQILLVDNRVRVSLQSLQGDKAHKSSYVTETLVYGIKTKADTATAPNDTTPKPLQDTANIPVSMETKLSQQSHTVQSQRAAGEAYRHSDQSSSGSSSAESQSRDKEGSSRRMKENVLGKSRFFSVEANNEQSPKRSRFALKKSVSTPNSSLSRSDSERASKSNKMDQVLNKIKQKFSPRRSEDDSSFPWKWKRTSQTPSVSGSSDVSNVSDNSLESAKTLEERMQQKEMVLNDSKKETDDADRWTQNRYTIMPSSAVGSTVTGDHFSIWSEKSTLDTNQEEKNTCAEHTFENKAQVHLTVDHPATHQLDFYKDSGTDYTASNQFLSCRDLSPCRSPNSSAAYPSQFRKSTPSPRSPFSPFASLSPLSPFSSPEVTDDSVFYSPKLHRRRETPSPCEPGEGISLGGSRRSRVSTGPPSVGPVPDKEQLASSYADLKYGIEPSRCFSVSSVLSSRPSGPGRISTGSRFMSMGDLSQSALSCGSNARDLSQWSVTPDWNKELDCQPASDSRAAYFPSDPGKMRSRSLPRSLTKCLANWSSGDAPSQPVTSTASRPAHLWSPNMNTCQFTWDTEGPPTPPPTPPMSPVSRRMSKPPSLSSPTFPSSSEALQQGDSQSSRGLLPSRGYVSSLSTFEESSDSNSDTTTDDEYYLESDEEREKETEL
ncbi:mucin-4 [Stegastes partitus]|uniref:Mucin-4 n=1 Tax=Stegastes partitus TaxID=144197 RepID=A0A9Y4N849_9TELE|nr:PREDICTED: mucin-4-like [Stegastes partitus]